MIISKIGQYKVKNLSIFHEILSNFSTLLSPSIGTPAHKSGREKSFLFMVWIFCSIIIHTFYVGLISSLLVKVPENDVMKNLTSLYQNNYKLVYTDEGKLDFVKSLATSAKFIPLTKMLNAARILPEPFLFEALAFEPNVAVVYLWTYAFNVAAAAKSLILRRDIVDSTFRYRECYVGKELWDDDRQSFIGVIPSNSGLVYEALQRLMAAGIYRYWFSEYEGLAISKRVQDRVKFISPTKIQLEEKMVRGVSVVPPLKLSGKIRTIFGLWSVCIGVCIILMFLEMFSIIY